MDDCPHCKTPCPIRVDLLAAKAFFACWDCLVQWDRGGKWTSPFTNSAMAGRP